MLGTVLLVVDVAPSQIVLLCLTDDAVKIPSSWIEVLAAADTAVSIFVVGWAPTITTVTVFGVLKLVETESGHPERWQGSTEQHPANPLLLQVYQLVP